MQILEVVFGRVNIKDDSGFHSHVVLQGDGRLKCRSSRCKARNHFTCEHVAFVQSQKVVFPELPPLREEDLAALIDE